MPRKAEPAINRNVAIGLRMKGSEMFTRLSPVSVASGFAAGTPVISAGVLFLVPSGIGSAETVSSVALSLLEILSAVGITSAVAVGIPAVETGVVTLLVVGINSGEQFGNIQLFTVEISKPSAENTRTTVADRIRQGVGISGRGGVTAAKPVGSGRSEVHSV